MSKSARIAIPSSLASRSSLTPPAASSASPRNTPTPPLEWKPQKQAPPRSRPLGAHVILDPSVEFNPASPLWTLVGQSFLTVPLFLEFHRESSRQLVPLLLSLHFLLFFQPSTLDFQLPSAPRPCTMNFHRGYSIPHVR